jgi:2-polyprenyl-3-methyl-5-hydroxy-6-metoxy-1,4-benzoquinol methylase
MGDADAASTIMDMIRARRLELGEAAPRFGLFLCDCVDAKVLRETIRRIPPELDDWFEEVVVMVDHRSRGELLQSEDLLGERRIELRFHMPPQDSGYGAARKGAFEYALLKGFDQVIVMRGDSSHPPEELPHLIQHALASPTRCVLATRLGPASASTRHRLAHRLSTFVQNRILGMRLADYHTSFRVYPSAALQRIPFQLNSVDRRFDAEVILQLRALDVPIHEEPLIDGVGGDGSGNDGLFYGLMACGTAIGYRLHQIHVTRNGRYLVDHDIRYTLKHSKTGSHMQIVSAIAPGSKVLDLGCSSGLLARPLLEKKVRVTGVDAAPGDLLAEELAEYYQRDLELPLELPFGRVFAYVICSDVIEHLQNRAQLLRGVRRYLKPDGRLIISTPNIALWFYRLSLLVGRFEYGPRGVLDETHAHLYTGSTFRREVENAGFHVLRERVTALPFEVVFESTGRSRLICGLATAYHVLARLWPSMFAYQYVLEARITTLDEESTADSSSRLERRPADEGSAPDPTGAHEID